MASVNKAVLLGRVGQSPKIVTFSSGDKVANLSLATSRVYKDRYGDAHEDTQWHNLVVGGKLADVVEKYVGKGQELYIEGMIQYRKYEDKDGVSRFVTEIRVDTLLMIGGRRDKDGNGRRPESDTVAAQNDGMMDDMPF